MNTTPEPEIPPVDEERVRLETLLQKAKKAQTMLPLMILVIAGSTAAQYAGLFSTGFLPGWVGIVLVVLLIFQIPFLAKKIKGLEDELRS